MHICLYHLNVVEGVFQVIMFRGVNHHIDASHVEIMINHNCEILSQFKIEHKVLLNLRRIKSLQLDIETKTAV